MPDMIRKSFEICGLVSNFDPERVLFMREGNSCHNVLSTSKIEGTAEISQLLARLSDLDPVSLGQGDVMNMVNQEEEMSTDKKKQSNFCITK